MIIYSNEYTHIYHTLMINFKKLSQFDLEIYEVSQQKHLTVDGDVASH
jgi:hypothetical protein